MFVLDFWHDFTKAISPRSDTKTTPVVVMIGTLPHTIKAIRREDHEDGGATIWIDAEES